MRYTVELEETIYGSIDVEAESQDQAEQIAYKKR